MHLRRNSHTPGLTDTPGQFEDYINYRPVIPEDYYLMARFVVDSVMRLTAAPEPQETDNKESS